MLAILSVQAIAYEGVHFFKSYAIAEIVLLSTKGHCFGHSHKGGVLVTVCIPYIAKETSLNIAINSNLFGHSSTQNVILKSAHYQKALTVQF